LEDSKAIIVLWSRHSVKSQNVIEEATEGKERGILLPVFIEKVKPPYGFKLLQTVNLVAWDGRDAPEFEKLRGDIEARVGPPRPGGVNR
jgi:hypothetical protein